MKDNQPSQLEFSIQRIQDCGFLINEVVDPNFANIRIGYGMEFTFNVDEGWMRYLIKVEFADADSKIVFLNGTVLTVFHINNFKSIYDKENQKVLFPPSFAETLFGIAFNHARAILSKNTQGSRYQGILVPLINPVEVFGELVKINFNKVEKTSETPKDIEDIELAPNTNTRRSKSKKATQ